MFQEYVFFSWSRFIRYSRFHNLPAADLKDQKPAGDLAISQRKYIGGDVSQWKKKLNLLLAVSARRISTKLQHCRDTTEW